MAWAVLDLNQIDTSSVSGKRSPAELTSPLTPGRDATRLSARRVGLQAGGEGGRR